MLATIVQAQGETARGLPAAVEAWRDQVALATFVGPHGVQVREAGAVRSLVLDAGEPPDAVDGPVLRITVGGGCFSVPLGAEVCWSAEVQSLNGGPEAAVLTIQSDDGWSLLLVEAGA